MKAELRFESIAATVILADEHAGVELRTRDIAEIEPLRDKAKVGAAFGVEAEDPWIGNLHVYVDEPVPVEIAEICSANSGSFLLRLPSGRLSVSGVGTESPQTAEPPEVHGVEVPPGDYAVSVLDGSARDIPALLRQEQALVDAADWRVVQWVDKIGALGCVSVALGLIFVLVPYTRRNLWYLLPLFLMPTCLFSLLRRLPHYRRVEERRKQHERSLPQVVVALTRVEKAEGLEGGWYRCG